MKKLKVGIAGIGFIGPAHIEALRRIPGIEVVSVMDNSDRLQELANSLDIDKYYDNFDDLMGHDDLDCIHICTPNFLHYEMARKALQKGINVVCEKPLATKIEEAEALVNLAKETGLVNAVHFNLRYYPMSRQIKMMKAKGELGEIYSVIGSYLQDWLFYDTDYNWRLEPDKSGDSRAVADIGSHLIDLLEYTTGLKIVEVMADFNTVHKTRKKPLKDIATYSGKLLKPEDYQEVPINTEDYATIMLRFDNGNKGVLTVSQVSAGRKNRLGLEISGSQKTISWNSESPNDLWIGHRDQANAMLMRDPALFHSEASKLISFPGGHNEGFPDTSKQMFKEVYAAIRAGGQPEQPTFPTFADGLRELNLNEKIIESHKEQRWVKV